MGLAPMGIKLNPLHSSGRGLCKNRGKAGLCSLQPPVPCTSWSINVAVTREELFVPSCACGGAATDVSALSFAAQSGDGGRQLWISLLIYSHYN